MNQAKIGAYLCRLRREKQLTQEELAEVLGVSTRTISRWETGSNLPDLSLLTTLADFYGVGVGELLNGEGKAVRKLSPVKLPEVAECAQIGLMLSFRGRNASATMTALLGIAPNVPATANDPDFWQFALPDMPGGSTVPILDALTCLIPRCNYRYLQHAMQRCCPAQGITGRLTLTVRAGDSPPFVLLTDDSIAFLYATGAALRLELVYPGEIDAHVEKAHCQFILRGDDLDLDAITERLALHPSDARKSADFPQVRAGTGYAQDLWMLETPDVDLPDLSDTMRTFGWLLTQKQETMQAVIRDFGCTSRIDLVLYLREFAFEVDCAWIRFAAETGAAIGFDLY